jgi:hypothetical protein
MMKFAYATADGGVAIVYAAAKEDLERLFGRTLTANQYRAFVLARSIPVGVTPRQLPDDWTPPDDRGFRDAWRLNGGTVFVHMATARLAHLRRIRLARDRKLKALDILWMRATARGETEAAAAVEAAREVLRNLPQTFDLSGATTPAELKALWPAELA